MRYTKEFLICAFLSRYVDTPTDKFMRLADMAENFYNEAGRDKFRVYCSLDAEALRVYKNKLAAGVLF